MGIQALHLILVMACASGCCGCQAHAKQSNCTLKNEWHACAEILLCIDGDRGIASHRSSHCCLEASSLQDIKKNGMEVAMKYYQDGVQTTIDNPELVGAPNILVADCEACLLLCLVDWGLPQAIYKPLSEFQNTYIHQRPNEGFLPMP